MDDKEFNVNFTESKTYKKATVTFKGDDIYLNIELPAQMFGDFENGKKEFLKPILKKFSKVIPSSLRVDVYPPKKTKSSLIKQINLITLVIKKGRKVVNSSKFVDELLRFAGELF